MSLRLQLDPKLGAGVDDRLHRALVDTARVTREIQAPPMLKVALEQADFALADATPTLIEFDSLYHDTHGWWDAAAWRYTPKRAGYYLCAWLVEVSFTNGQPNPVACVGSVAVKESGTVMGEVAGRVTSSGASTPLCIVGSTVIYCDGSASYIELYATVSPAGYVLSTAGRSSFSIAYMGDNALR